MESTRAALGFVDRISPVRRLDKKSVDESNNTWIELGWIGGWMDAYRLDTLQPGTEL